MSVQEQHEIRPLRLKPIISYPHQAEIGKSYLLSIDVQLEQDEIMQAWPYPEEEYAIAFILNLHPYFSYRSLGKSEPTIVIHRFGGTYGPAEYLLTAAEQEIPAGKIAITLVNGWGIPLSHVHLPCEIKREIQVDPTRQLTLVPRYPVTPQAEPVPIYAKGRKTGSEREEGLDLRLQQTIEQVKNQLLKSGWAVQRESQPDWSERQGVAIRDYPFSVDDVPTFMLNVNQAPIGLVNVYPPGALPMPPDSQPDLGIPRGKRQFDSTELTSGILAENLPFVYETDGSRTRFSSLLEPPEARRRQIFTIHRPETLRSWLNALPRLPGETLSENNLLRSRLRHLPEQPVEGLEGSLREALMNLERILATNQTRVLVQVTPGYDTAMLAVPSIYRLLTFGGARRVLYLTDERNSQVNEQPPYIREQFERYLPPGESRSMRRIYTFSTFDALPFNPEIHVSIMTIQQLAYLLSAQSDYIPYNDRIPIETFDMIFIDDARLCVQPEWQRLMQYFDAILVGFLNGDDKDTLRFFGGEVACRIQTPPSPATASIFYALGQREQVLLLSQNFRLHGVQIHHHEVVPGPFEERTQDIVEALKIPSIVVIYAPSQLEWDKEVLFDYINEALLKDIPAQQKLVATEALWGLWANEKTYPDTNLYPADEIIAFSPVPALIYEKRPSPARGEAQFIKNISFYAFSARRAVDTSLPTNNTSVSFRTFQPIPPQGEIELDINWLEFFEYNQWPEEEIWKKTLLPALHDVRWIFKELSITNIQCYGQCRMSAAFLFGLVFSRQGGFMLLLEGRDGAWSTNMTHINAPVIRSMLETHAESTVPSEGEPVTEGGEEKKSALVEIAISHEVTTDVTQYLTDHPIAHQYRLHIRAQEGPGRYAIQGASQAVTMAWQIRRRIAELCQEQDISHIHIFGALPHRLAALLGHYLQGVDINITFYEFEMQERQYKRMYAI